MRSKIFPSLLLAVPVFFTACAKNNSVPPPSYQDAVYFYIPYIGHDVDPTFSGSLAGQINFYFSSTYSFYFNKLAQDTIWLPDARILGNTAARDRVINITATDSGTTAIAGKHYRLFNAYTMPADSFSTGKLGVIVLRSPDLDTSTVTLRLQIGPSKDFPGPMFVTDTLLADKTFYSGTSFTLKITAQALQPTYWVDVSYLMGSWSRVKYEFIYSVTGVYLGLTPNNAAEQQNLFNYLLKVTTALQAYNNAHPGDPLTDENGNAVSF